jgi:zinc/manganese transport system ATP-binding protein
MVAGGCGNACFGFFVAGRCLGAGISTLVELDNLTVSYQQHPALHHVSGQFAAGSLTAIAGPNGAGKSTLLKSMVALVPCDKHQIRVGAPRHRITYLPQQSEIDRNFPITVLDCVLLGFWAAKRVWARVTTTERERAYEALHTVGLADFAHRPIGSLSAGQLQRTLFARMLVQDADLVLLDEPFNAMDAKTTATLLEVVKAWHQQQRTVVAVLHDDAQISQHFPQTLLLAREVVAWGSTAQVMTAANLQRARAMAEAWDESASWCERDQSATGTVLR